MQLQEINTCQDTKSPDRKKSLLSVRDLKVSFKKDGKLTVAVRGADFDLFEGEILGLVGETGSGKSVTCKAVTGLLPGTAVTEGNIFFRGQDLLKLKKRELNMLRGRAVSMIFQDPQGSLNPVKTVYSHLREVINKEERDRNSLKTAKKLLKSVHIPKPGKRLKDYPFQFSGGMAQRVQIAMALTNKPEILIADEPTTALDVTIQAMVLNEIVSLSRKRNLSVILITHDFGIISEVCDRVCVMYHGKIVETGNVRDVIQSPRHPYTMALLESTPVIGRHQYRINPIKGDLMPAGREVRGCDFSERCDFAESDCLEFKPEAITTGERTVSCFHPVSGRRYKELVKKTIVFDSDSPWIMKIKNISCSFSVKNEDGAKDLLKAVDDVSLNIRRKDITGIVGESGSGKSTLARMMMGLQRPDSGKIVFKNEELYARDWDFRNYTGKVQYIFQDPLGALDPRMSVIRQVAEPLKIHRIGNKKSRFDAAADMLLQCGLNSDFFYQKPLSLSGGQRQRVVIARALVMGPEIIICDEPVSALDVSVQAQILNLIEDLSEKKDITVIFISHDLSVVNNICNKVAVMFAGRILEHGNMQEIYNRPGHPYTKLLLNSVPGGENGKLSGDTSSYKIPKPEDDTEDEDPGCPFYFRCGERLDICLKNKPEIKESGNEHEVACFRN